MTNAFFILAQTTALQPESPPVSQSLLHAVLLVILWMTVAAVVIGLLVRHRLGNLWLRKDNQPFLDDAGGPH